jgi:radical SAM superfamily enzyme YgiQ (UPF0313 family)
MRALEVQLVQVNFRYGDNAYLPYSVGLLEAFARSDQRIKQVTFRDTLFLRKSIPDAVNNLHGVDVLAISCYLWNWNWSLELAKQAKARYPNLFVVLGGPQVPEENKNFLLENTFIDAIVFNEGEQVFSNLLYALTSDAPDLAEIDGISFRKGDEVITTKAQEKISDLSSIESPYLSGVFDSIMAGHDLQFQVTQETHRGCPYSCTFCDWGSSTMSKVRRVPKDRIIAEYHWFGKNKIELLYNADANYGLFAEDVELTEKLIETKSTFGFPKKFRAAYAKNSNERVFEIATMLENENMCKGVTLSFQSMDSNVLTFIKRKNMKVNNFKELITTYREAKIPTYTELIIGLPGETYETFKYGIDTLLEAGQHDSLSIYNAMLLENSEMNKEAYKQLHGIKSARIPLLLLHGSIEPDDVVEFYDVVTTTNTMPSDKWVKTTVFAWMVQALHCLNLTQAIAAILNSSYSVKYSDFYEMLIEKFETADNHIGKLIEELQAMARGVAEGYGTLDLGDRSYGNIMWPVEEIIFLRLVTAGETFSLFGQAISEIFPDISQDHLTEIIRYQKLSLRLPTGPKKHEEIFEFDWHSYTSQILLNQDAKLIGKPTRIGYHNLENFTDLQEYAREVVWYGRKGSSLINQSLYSEDL